MEKLRNVDDIDMNELIPIQDNGLVEENNKGQADQDVGDYATSEVEKLGPQQDPVRPNNSQHESQGISQPY